MKTKTIMIAATLAVGLTSCSRQTEKQKEFAIAREAVSQQLLAPSSAKFCTAREAGVFRAKNGDQEIDLWVDAQNQFGVPIRRDWMVMLDPKTHQVKSAVCVEDAIAKIQRDTAEQIGEIKASTEQAVRSIQH